MEQEEADSGDWPRLEPPPPPPPPQCIGSSQSDLSLDCQAQVSRISSSRSSSCSISKSSSSSSSSSSSKMPFAFTAAAVAAAAPSIAMRVQFSQGRQTQSAAGGQIASLADGPKAGKLRPSWPAKLLILGLVALAWRELFPLASKRFDLSIGRHDDNERSRQLAHCPLAVCPASALVGAGKISGSSNRFGPLLVFAAAAEANAPNQSLNNTSAGGNIDAGGQAGQANNNNNNNETTTTRAAAVSDLRTKVAAANGADAAGDANTRTDQNQQQQLEKADLNSRRTTTNGSGSDLPLIIRTKQQQQQQRRRHEEEEEEQQQQQQQQGDLTGKARMTSVVCNSRCRCIQLELANDEQNGPDGLRRGQQRARDEMPASGGGLAGWLAKLAGGTSAASSSSASSSAAASGQIELMMSLPGDNNEIASDTNSSSSSSVAEATAKSNKIALIEFGQDYSFDELDEFGSSNVEFERAGPDELPASEQTTIALAGTGNGNHHHVGPAAAAAAASASSMSTHELQQRATPAVSGNAQLVAAANSTIKHANDQSKDVNVSTGASNVTATSTTTPPPPLPPALLSIKYNKTGAQAQAQPASTLYPNYLSMAKHHKPRPGQRHKLMPGAFNQQMSARDFQRQDEQEMPRVARISPLRSLNLTRNTGQLTSVETIVQMLKDVEAQSVQSLVLSHNRLTFETWTQLYALLTSPLRRHIYHLDLSHNSLAKLGVTFTGYIEHHLGHQLIVQHNQTWPFSSPLAQNQPSYLQFKLSTSAAAARPPGSSSSAAEPSANELLHHQAIGARATRAQKQHQKLLSQQQQLRHPNLGEGKLYNAVRSELPVEVSSLLVQSAIGLEINITASEQQTYTQPSVHRKSQNTRVPQTILHQAAKVKALDLSYNKLEWLINDQFRVLKHVESIRLDHNQIRYIHQQAFNGLEELKYLNLNYNRIQTIYMEQFQTNFNLRALFLQSNYLTYLRADSLAALDKLKRLDLSRNKFSLLSNNAFAGLNSLEFLNLSSNQFVHVPSTSFHSLATASLRELDLSRNQLAQLMPGTFFHLKLERLWLDENAQLVAIDRGAFWDLPNLSELSLRSNQMLLNINSQAFVGLPNIRAINYDECPLLDADTRQMLDNVTRAATMRHLIQVGQPLAAEREQPAQLAGANRNNSTAPGQSTNATHQNEHMRLQMASSDLLVQQQQQQQQMPYDLSSAGIDHKQLAAGLFTKSAMKYVYSVACLVLIVIAVKLVFNFTSTGHRLGEGRRRRRRVYQSSASSLSSAGEDSLSSATSATSSSSAANYCDELLQPPGCMSGFAMCEQQPQGALNLGAGKTTSCEQEQTSAPALSECEPTSNLDSLEELGVQLRSAACCDLDQLQVAASSANCPCPDCCAHQVGQQVCMDGIETGGAETGLAPLNEDAGRAGADTFQGNICCDIPNTTTDTNTAETMPTTTTGAAGQDETGGGSQQDSAAMDLIHDQLVAAGYGDYGHAKCAHFYQSLGPALQLADLTASLVNQMDYYS